MKFVRLLESASTGGAILSAIFMGLIVLLIMAEIVLRTFFGTSTLIASEYSGYFLVAVVIFGFAYTFRENAHIRITLVYSSLGREGRRIVDILVGISSAAIVGYLFWYSTQMVMESYELEMAADSVSETLLWKPQLVIPLGLALFFLQIVAFIVRRVRK